MLLALKDSERIYATPGQRAICPACGGNVVAKCGDILEWHWAHERCDCDPWSEPESKWHIGWKSHFPESNREVVVGCHRADVKTSRWVIEFQKSQIDARDIADRERHYGQMIWVICGTEFTHNMKFRNKGDYWSFRWKHPRKSWWSAQSQLFIDFSEVFVDDYESVLEVRKIHHKTPCAGWGVWRSREHIVNGFF